MMQTEREYADALFVLAAEEGNVPLYQKHLRTVRDAVLQTPEYIDFLRSPAIPLSERLQAIDEAFGSLPEYIVSFLKLLCENGRLPLLTACIAEFDAMAMALANKTTATVYSAVELSEQQKSALTAKLETLSGKTVEATFAVDPSLIGGIRIDMEGRTYDGSIKRRLREVKDVIIG